MLQINLINCLIEKSHDCHEGKCHLTTYKLKIILSIQYHHHSCHVEK